MGGLGALKTDLWALDLGGHLSLVIMSWAAVMGWWFKLWIWERQVSMQQTPQVEW